MVEKIFVNGTFDVLHPGHIRLLTYAKELGTYLFVAIDSDDRVKKLKGIKRPINNEDVRKEMLLALKPVDKVDVFSTDDELRYLIQNYNPDVMVIGSDYRNKPVIGSELIRSLVFYDRISEYSSTKTIQSIINR